MTPKRAGKLSAIDAAAKVLAESNEPLTTKEMIEAMAAKGYWTSPGGQTPAQTLYAAILREPQRKGEAARFVKVERGRFALRTKAAAQGTKTARHTTAGARDPKPADGTPGPKSISELFNI